MNIRALTGFRKKLSRGDCVHGLWVTLESASITEIAVAMGMDWVVIDAEHGHLDWHDIHEHIRAAVRSETVVLVRLAERSTALTKRALDIGADGVVIPWVETVEQFEAAVSDCRFPPEGRRGIGGERATAWGQCLSEHTQSANESVLVIPLIESVAAVPHVAAMCDVDGAEVFFFGPADFSATAGFRGQWEGPGVADQILNLRETICAAGHHCGVMVTSLENQTQRTEQGFQMLGVASDTGLLIRGLHQSLKAADCDRSISATLDSADCEHLAMIASRPPKHLRPDRNECLTRLVDAEAIDLEVGVVFHPLANSGTSTHGLTTGIAELQPNAALPLHRHPCTEAVTVLEGEAEIAVEGRAYRLKPRDTIVIPRWLPHTTRNCRTDYVTRLHNVFGQDNPERELVSREFVHETMGSDDHGKPGAEYLTRATKSDTIASRPWTGTDGKFADEKLVPGIEFSGRISRLQPGELLPSCVAEFDYAVCVTAGELLCHVEGRSYAIRLHETMFIPAGRVCRLSNQSTETADLIRSVSAPSEAMIRVAEECAAVSDAAWPADEA